MPDNDPKTPKRGRPQLGKKPRVQFSTWTPAEAGEQMDKWHAARAKRDPKTKMGDTLAEVVKVAKAAGYTGKQNAPAPSTATGALTLRPNS